MIESGDGFFDIGIYPCEFFFWDTVDHDLIEIGFIGFKFEEAVSEVDELVMVF